MRSITTIGYQTATVGALLEALQVGGVDLLVDIRAVASSRRPGFSKSQLAANVGSVGIEYLHLRGLGTPAEGRAAARAGSHDKMRRIYGKHLATAEAQEELSVLAGLIRSGRHVCLLCFEADPAHCHRTLVADALTSLLPLRVAHLLVPSDE